MILRLQKAFSVGAINPNISVVRSSRAGFQQTADKVQLFSLDRFISESAIRRMIDRNPKVKSIVKNFNPNMELNMDELRELLQHHTKDTQNISSAIVEHLPFSLQTQIDKQELYDAAYLHDLGKVLIPKSVLNKPARLNSEELKIMDTHSQLSFELLKTSGLNKRTLELIRNHHQKQSLLNQVLNKKNNDYTLQILSTADKYSALTEDRVYKKAMSPKEALTIIYQDVENRELDIRVFNALTNYVNKLAKLESLAVS